MAQIIPFIRPHTTFDPEAAAALGAAYDRAIAGIHMHHPKFVRDVIAKRIVSLGARGERDPERLCEAALSGLRVAR